MANIVPMLRSGALTRQDPRRLALFRKTTGKHLLPTEIDEAIEWCEIFGANPFVKDIYFFVFDATDAEKRRLAPVLSIGMYRKIAARTKNYRPDDRPARFTYDPEMISPSNPSGMVDCEVTVYQHTHGEWFPNAVKLRWEERAPITNDAFEWKPREPAEVWPPGHKRAGKPKMKKVPVGEPCLDPGKKNWLTMPETMMAKCTEAAAIRKGWPNETAGSYVEGELDQVHTIELTATEIIDEVEREDRLTRIGGARAVMIDWCDGEPLERVPAGQFHDKAMAFIAKHMKADEEEAGEVMKWRDRNRHSINEFWALEKDAALNLKMELEKIEASIKAAP